MKSSIFSVSSRAMPDDFGITAPKTKAPKIAWIPIRSVASAESRTPTRTTATWSTERCPCSR